MKKLFLITVLAVMLFSNVSMAQTHRNGSITLAFTGDIMMGTNFPDNSTMLRDGGSTLFKNCSDILKRADAAIGNLEGTLYDGTDGEIHKNLKSKTTYIFRMPGVCAKYLANAGIDIVNFANNHSFDFGDTGRRKTLATVQAAGIKLTGLKGLAEGCVIERNGVKIGFVSFAAACTKVLDLNNPEEVKRIITKYRSKCDILAVGFHGGAEGSAATHVTRAKEVFLGENRGNVYDFAHKCIDWGADIVVGHGPHVPRAMELYKGHLIAYSLGNFCTPFKVNLKGISGHAPLLEVELNTNNGTLKQGQIHSFIQTHGGAPKLDAANSAANDIRSLTLHDFPNTPLIISKTGKITRKQ